MFHPYEIYYSGVNFSVFLRYKDSKIIGKGYFHPPIFQKPLLIPGFNLCANVPGTKTSRARTVRV